MSVATAQGTMVAYRYHPGAAAVVPEEVPIPAPGEGQVLIKVLAAGVCHSDVTIYGDVGKTWPAREKHTLGHECAGLVHALGQGVRGGWKEGDYVAILGCNPCCRPECAVCAQGQHNMCKTFRSIGLGADGAWAPWLVTHEGALVAVPGNDTKVIPPAVASVATDAVLTPWHALKTCAGVRPGQTVLVVGCGGLGLNAVQIAKRCLGAGRVIASDLREASLALALKVGADDAVPSDSVLEYLDEHALAVDVAVDFVGVQASFQLAMMAVRPGGLAHLVGLGASRLEFPVLLAITKDLRMGASYWGTKPELSELLEAIAAGKIRPEVEERPLEDCVSVMEALHDGLLKSRVALVP